MSNVRTLAKIFFWAGWAGLILSVIQLVGAILFLPQQGFMAPQPTFMMVAGSLSALFLPLASFFAWGVLTALDEILDRLATQP